MTRLHILGMAAVLATPALAQPAPPPPQPSQPPIPGAPPGGPGARGGPGAFRFEGMLGYQSNFTYMLITSNKAELKLTDAQSAEVEALYKDSTKSRTDLMQKQRTISDDLRQLTAQESPNMTTVEAKVRELQAVQSDSMLADIKTNQKYRAVLTAAQKEQLKTLSPRPPMPGGMGGTARPPMAPGAQPAGVPAPPPSAPG